VDDYRVYQDLSPVPSFSRYNSGNMSFKRILLCLIIFACVPLPSVCQKARTEGASDKAPLRYRLVVLKPSVCPKESLTLELELRNTSRHRVLIDRTGLLYQVSILGERHGEGSTGDRFGEPTKDEVVALEPGESYRRTISYPLRDSAFSETERVHSIRVTYGQFFKPSPKFPELFKGVVESNKVLFEVTYCENANP
jgi:hypothetical protein